MRARSKPTGERPTNVSSNRCRVEPALELGDHVGALARVVGPARRDQPYGLARA